MLSMTVVLKYFYRVA